MSRLVETVSTAALVIAVTLMAARLAGSGMPQPASPASKETCVAIVVNHSNTVENLSLRELRKVFLGETSHWANGRRITVVMLERGQAEREAVLRIIFRMGESDYEQYFLHATFTGRVLSPPKLLATAEGVRKFVSLVPGAIGYLRSDELDRSVSPIRVDGIALGDAEYKIKIRER